MTSLAKSLSEGPWEWLSTVTSFPFTYCLQNLPQLETQSLSSSLQVHVVYSRVVSVSRGIYFMKASVSPTLVRENYWIRLNNRHRTVTRLIFKKTNKTRDILPLISRKPTKSRIPMGGHSLSAVLSKNIPRPWKPWILILWDEPARQLDTRNQARTESKLVSLSLTRLKSWAE